MSTSVRTESAAKQILEVENLSITYRGGQYSSIAARDVSFSVNRGEIFGLVGETGSGKSTILRSTIGLLHKNARVEQGTIRVAENDVTTMDHDALERLRRKHVAMIFQDPLRALNPVMTVGAQLEEVLRVSGMRDRESIFQLIIETLERVGIADAQIRLRAYPHELSGGLRQRVSIAAAIIRSPELILADEPTTALDVTIQDQILTLLHNLCRNMGMSVVFVTHDIGVIAEICDKVGVLYAGRMVETGDVKSVLTEPSHPYTAALLASVPRIGENRDRLRVIQGHPPDLSVESEGCPFAPRCEYARSECETIRPVLDPHTKTQASACWRHNDLQTALKESIS